MNKNKKYISIIIILLFVFMICNRYYSSMNLTSAEITNFKEVELACTKQKFSEFKTNLEEDKIQDVYADFTTEEYGNTFFYTIKDDKTVYMTDNPQYEEFKKELLENDVTLYSKAKVFPLVNKLPMGNTNVAELFSILINTLCLVFIFIMIKNMSSGLNGFLGNNDSIYKIDPNDEKENDSSSNKTDENTTENNTDKKLDFSNVGGLKEVKKDLKSVVDFIKNPDKYAKNDAKLPKGVLLVGPPGTGKTLLAKVIAKEAQVPFLYMAGSDFVEMYGGKGAARGSELFKEARKHSPCIVFIDEIDTLCGKRGIERGEHSEDRKTLTALLAEMDGFKDSSNILVIGATNRLDDIDKAALRPGRFTEIFHVPIPETMEERMEVINIYAKNKKFSEDVDLKDFCREMIGRSPAEIEAVLNESAIISVQKSLEYINKECLEEAFYKRVMQGHQKDNKETNPIDLKVVAYHEAGHALIAKLHEQSVIKVTIAPSTSGAGGVPFTQPSERKLYSKKMLMNRIKQLYGGKVAEYLLYNKDWDSTTGGCSQDIEQATSILKEMADSYGMSEIGLVNMNVLSRDSMKETNEFVFKMSKQLLDETIKEMEENYDKLEAIANALLEHETIYEATIDEILEMD